MTSKSKPSTWQPGGLEALKGFDDLYSEDVRQAINEAMPEDLSADACTTLSNAALDIALEVYAARQLTDRPTHSEIKAGLSEIHDKAGGLLEALALLDHDSRKLLHKIADPKNEDDVKPSPADEAAIVEPYGDIALAKTTRQIEKLQRWCKQAIGKLEKPRPGPKPDKALKAAMKDLADAWEEVSGKRPSGQSRADFASAVLSPVVGEGADFDWHWR